MKNKTSLPTREAFLIEKASAGDQTSFEEIVDQYRPVLNLLAQRMLRNKDDANDAVQETFVKAFKSLADFDPSRPLRPWLCRICSNCCIDIVRDRKKSSGSIDEYEYMLESKDSSVEDQAEESIDSEEIRGAITRLPKRYREILLMRHFRHMDVVEIASALNKPEGTIKSWLFRGRALLRRDMVFAARV